MTKIEWTEATWNPIVGCSIVSPGCTNCYAMTMAGRLEAMSGANAVDCDGYAARGKSPLDHYRGTTKHSKAGPVWTGRVAIAPDHVLLAPLRRRKPTMYFVNSMGDLFHEDVPDEWITKAFVVMAGCQHHTFQVLTKRAARMREWLSEPRRHLEINVALRVSAMRDDRVYSPAIERLIVHNQPPPWPLPNVWLGVSTERQQEANARIPDLLATPAAVRFISAEPLLGPIDLNQENALWTYSERGTREPVKGWPNHPRGAGGLDWVIVGGESGKNARPMHPDWARSIRDQCTAASVPFFFKQWGEWAPGVNSPGPQTRTERIAHFWDGQWDYGAITKTSGQELHHDDEPDVYRFGKRASGRLLDGREWNETPA